MVFPVPGRAHESKYYPPDRHMILFFSCERWEWASCEFFSHSKPLFPPIDIQQTQCPRECLYTIELCRSNVKVTPRKGQAAIRVLFRLHCNTLPHVLHVQIAFEAIHPLLFLPPWGNSCLSRARRPSTYCVCSVRVVETVRLTIGVLLHTK